MPQFSLGWDISDITGNENNLSQRASYRQKSVGGAWLITGFTPANPLGNMTDSVISPNLLANVFYEFIIEAFCTTNGPTANDNGIVEKIAFACLNPTVSKTQTATTISLDVTGLDVNAATFTLKRKSDNVVIRAAHKVAKVGNLIQTNANSLVASTAYYWEFVQHATGASGEQSGVTCGPHEFTTDAPASCAAPKTLTVTNI